MKKKIAILGSTGSIGKSTLEVIRKDKKNFDIILLTTNNNYKEILKQSQEFKVRNLIINNQKYFIKAKKKLKKKILKFLMTLNLFKKNLKIKLILRCPLFLE